MDPYFREHFAANVVSVRTKPVANLDFQMSQEKLKQLKCVDPSGRDGNISYSDGTKQKNILELEKELI